MRTCRVLNCVACLWNPGGGSALLLGAVLTFLSPSTAVGAPAAPGPPGVSKGAATTPSSGTSGEDLADLVKRLQVEKEAAEARLSLTRLKQEEKLAELRAQIERLEAETALAAARRQRRAEKLEEQLADSMSESGRLAAERKKLEQQLAVARTNAALDMQRLQSRLEKLEAERSLEAVVDGKARYVEHPYRAGILEISRRRIALNGVITMATADHVTDRLNFFNNKSELYPIFIVIDYSPGGSVMAGYRIIKAIEASRSPVHVVVKSFAASLAAVITTLAPHSYAYPNAILLHHQLSGGNGGNLTEQREQVKRAEEWSRRLLGPLCNKLKMTQEKFVHEMYRHDSTGDWSEFADRAARLGWVQHVVKEVRERGVTQLPAATGQDASASPSAGAERRDAQGRSYVELPRLRPFDLWFLHDPDDYYR